MQDFSVSIKNLGAIQSADIQIKPLTVFVGKNNTGKTWVAEIIAGLLDNAALNSYIKYCLQNPQKTPFTILNTISEELISGHAYSLDLVDFVSKSIVPYFEQISGLCQKWVNNIVGTSQNLFDTFTIHLSPIFDEELLKKSILQINIDKTRGIGENLPKVHMVKKAGSPTLLISIIHTDDTSVLPNDVVRKIVHSLLYSYLHAVLSSSVYYLPAERTGIISFMQYQKQEDNNEYKLPVSENDSSHMKSSSLRMAQPIGSLYYKIRFLQQYPELEQQFLVQRNLSKNKKFIDLANRLENEILSGSLTYEKKPDINTQTLRYIMHESPGITLELPAVSSTVKDMVPLVLYLRYYLGEGNTLFIDEPEMNLHPENQAKFMEFLTILVNTGIRVIMVTHSPFMVNHLNNLIVASDSKNKKNIKDVLYLKDQSSFISKDMVSVYEFKNGIVDNLMQDDGLNLQTYDEVTNNLSSIYMRV